MASSFWAITDSSNKQNSFPDVFCHEEGDRVAEICWVKRPLRQPLRCLCSFSITEEGTYLETSTLPIPNEPDDDHFILQGVPHSDVVEMQKIHRQRLWQLEEARETRPVELAQHNLEQSVLYGQKLLYERLMRNGLARENPYEGVSFASQDLLVPVAV